MKRVLGVVVLVVTAVLGSIPGASPAASTERAHWRFDNSGTPRRAVDSTRFDNHGKNHDIVGTGHGYRFNGTSSRVVVPDSRSLDPRRARFSFGVTIVMRKPPAKGETYDVMRKGLASTKGGHYKLEIIRRGDSARASCLVRDRDRDGGSAVALADLADGERHTITCSRTSRGVSIRIDRRPRRLTRVADLGAVSNDSRLGLGAKAERKATTGFDWFKGRINDAWLRVPRG